MQSQPSATPTSPRRFNSGPRLHSENPGRHQNGTKNAENGAAPDLVFQPRWAKLGRWLLVLLRLRKAEMRVVCAWCTPQREIGRKACAWTHAGLTSHSICPECLAFHFPRIEAARKTLFGNERLSQPLFRTIVGEDWAEALARKEPNPVKAQIREQLAQRIIP